MKMLVIDNYDSFTYNLVHILRDLGIEPDVFRNDKISVDEVGQYDKILLSPGPGLPSEAGIMPELIRTYAPSKSILGVCLGHQAIAEAFGSDLYNLREVLHGVTSATRVVDTSEYLFSGLPDQIRVTHYHSWAVEEKSIKGDLKVTARNDDGVVMALAHQTYDVRGLQFHPESIMTEHGKKIIENWVTNTEQAKRGAAL
ncbi:MAG: aminodeoxychorismate/anthranilate synthase component II [Bacteroidetes bacterium]|nr:aminodeoxychorismate/anthranilate synthase component II [Bacteroidota bacterium]